MTFEFSCRKVRETDAAILVEEPVSGLDIWFPLTQVEEMHFHVKTGLGTMVVSDWIAKEKGLL